MRSIVLCTVLSMTLGLGSALAADLATGSRCELSKNLKVSAKEKGKGKKTKLKKGTVLEVVELGDKWSQVSSDAGEGWAKTKKLTKVCAALESEPAEEAPADEAEGGDEAAEETPVEEPPAEGEGETPPAEETPAEGDEADTAGSETAVEGASTEAAGDTASADATMDAGADATATDTPVEETPPVEPAPEVEEESDGPEDMLEFGFGLMAPLGVGDVTGYGVGGMLELRYNITANFAAGVRLEGDVLFSGEVKGSSASVGLSVTQAYLLEGEAQIWDSGFSPVGGLGVGLYRVGGASADAGSGGVEAGTLFGIAPKVGIDLGGFRIAALFHLLFGETVVVGASAVKRNFLAIELSGQIGFL